MEKLDIKEIKRKANEIKPVFSIGKAGITSALIEGVEDYLTKHSIAKIKVLSAIDKNQVYYYAEEMAKETDSEIIEKKGFTFVIYRN